VTCTDRFNASEARIGEAPLATSDFKRSQSSSDQALFCIGRTAGSSDNKRQSTSYFFFCLNVLSTRLRLLPTFLTAFFTADADLRAFFAS